MDFRDILNNRRAINFFDSEKDVDDTVLNDILTDAVRAPSSFNLQPWNVIVVRNQTEKNALRKVAWDQPKVSEAPVVLIVLGDREGWKPGNATFEHTFADNIASGKMTEEQREWFQNATRTLYGEDDMASQAFANKNAGLFAMSFMFAASDHGLHTHPMDGFDRDGVRKEFAIPDQYWPAMLIAVGYLKPGMVIHPQRRRKNGDELVLRFK